MPSSQDERQPLLTRPSQPGRIDEEQGQKIIRFSDNDPEHPRNWTTYRKMANVAVISSMAILSPLASSSFTPGISDIAADLGVEEEAVIGATTGFVILLGVGPLVLAPLSETFGRRLVYLICFSSFAALQIPTALSPNVETLWAMRTLSGFFGSVGIANGGGTISDMFEPSERAGVFGWYLLGPILGPALGPLLGGVIIQFLSWRWIFWTTAILSGVVVACAFVFLKESYAPTVLAARKRDMEEESKAGGGPGEVYTFEGEDPQPLWTKLAENLWRPAKILFTQPIVLIMALYQAVLWSCNFSLYTQFENIWGDEYGFEPYQVGMMYLPLGLGFLIAAWFIVPRIDTVYNYLTKQHGGKARPEFRLPLANIGAVLTPICLFAFAWLVNFRFHWALVFTLVPFGIGQISIFNCTQNYYIDSFEKYAASAIAAGSFFRSLVGGIVPVFIPALIEALGYGWGISLFGFASLLLAPAPMLFYYYGPALREKFQIDL